MSVIGNGYPVRATATLVPNGFQRNDIKYDMNLALEVDDAGLRQNLGPGFDGMERPFVLFGHPGAGEWEKRYLPFAHTRPARVPSESDTDVYSQKIPGDWGGVVEYARNFGLAFGLDTNLGTLYLQSFGDNLRPSVSL